MCKGGGRGAGGLSTGGAVLSVRVSLLVWAFGVAKDTDGEVFDVGGPLRRQLEKLDIVPLDAVDGDSQHGLLLFGSADEAADALDHLTLGLHLLVFALFLAGT